MESYEENRVKWLIDKPGGLFLTRRSGTLRRARGLSTSDFTNIGVSESQNLFNNSNLKISTYNFNVRATVYALGAVDMVLEDRENRTVRIVNNSATDYDWNRVSSSKFMFRIPQN